MIRKNREGVFSGGSPDVAARRRSRRNEMTLLATAVAASPVIVAVLWLGAPETPAAPGDFVTVWETTLPDEAVTFPGLGTYTIDWGDGIADANVTGPQTHAYAVPGSHAVSVSGLTRIFGDCQTGAQKLKSIEQWGNAGWTGMADMSEMFRNAGSFDGDLSEWDVSGVTAMYGMFSGADSFRQNLGNWYVVPADAACAASEGTLNVTTVSAQNPILDGHSPEYGIGSGGDSGLFGMAGNVLAFNDAPSAREYAVNVTASGHIFGNGNNWRMLKITVTGDNPLTIHLGSADAAAVQTCSAHADGGATCPDAAGVDPASLGSDYPGAGISNLAMTESGVPASRGITTMDGFVTALAHVRDDA